jgi:hypothetical protein
MERDAGLIFLIWMLMFTMSGTVLHRSRARDVLSLYEEDSGGRWILPILMGLGHGQYSRFDPLRMWYKDPRQETQWRFIENMAWHTTPEMRDSKYQKTIACPMKQWKTSWRSFVRFWNPTMKT